MNFTNNFMIFPKNIDTYLGQKGYTINKKDLNNEQIEFIKKTLTIKPYVQGAPNGGNVDSFFAYRESVSKLYVPRYFGEEHFGSPKTFKINEGEDIDIKFNGTLRDYQEPVVNKFLNYLREKPSQSGLLDLYCAWGKTSASLYMISALKKKTLVVVHKGFLLDQWVERIKHFLPEARIGVIQGKTVDVENKDIVIGMLQSLYIKDYPPGTFDSFGFTIFDEVHHISSQEFSNALFRIVTKYMLGLSATMNRKDGTTYVFKMFLGDIVHKAIREDDTTSVVVRAVDYYVDDNDFNKIEYDYRGNPLYSTMISKLCEYNHRSEFILRIISDMMKENEKQQIMVLAHNKNLLKYLHDAIEHRNIASVGYYIGGMKEKDRKISETKKIIIATYSMAAEGLDIKTLTTLIMATPKTDIEQSVGRILRERHSKPVVVDIIDNQDLFQNQWKKRKTFYKKQNYKIIYTNIKNYDPDVSTWDILFNPNGIVSRKNKNTNNTTNKTSINNSNIFNKIINIKTDIENCDDSDSEDDNNTLCNSVKKDNLLQGKCLIKL